MLAFVVSLAGVWLLLGCRGRHPGAEDQRKDKVQAMQPVAVTVVPVEMRPLERKVAVVGTLYGFEQITVTPKVEGKVVAIFYDVGDRVPPGALLLEIDATDYQLAVQEAERALQAELARLGLTELPGDNFDIEQLPSVESARLIRENAARRYQREKELFARNAGVLQQFEQAETDLKVADAKLRQARLDASAILAAARHRQALLDVARQRLADTRLYAPVLPAEPGTRSPPYDYVVVKRLLSVGEMVRAFPSTAAFELVRDDILKLRVLVPERYLKQVQVGMQVSLRSEAYPQEEFPATVARVYPTINPANRCFEVEAHVANFDHRLRHGGFAKAEVVISRNEHSPVIPIDALVQVAGVQKVFVVKNGVVRAVEIQVGTQGSGWIEAIGNLQEGDLVVTSGQSRLVDGAAVQVQQPVKVGYVEVDRISKFRAR